MKRLPANKKSGKMQRSAAGGANERPTGETSNSGVVIFVIGFIINYSSHQCSNMKHVLNMRSIAVIHSHFVVDI